MTTRPPTLIDAYMPTYDVRARYATRVRAPAAATYEALKRTDLAGSWIVRLLLAIRGLPARVGRPRGRPPIRTLAELARGGALLEEDPGRELVVGLIGRFWALRRSSRRPVSPTTFRGFDEPGFAKAVMGFDLIAIDTSTTLLGTETRVLCTDAASRTKFRLYWALIGPFSGLTRIMWLAAVRAAAERRPGASPTALTGAIPSPGVTAAEGESRGRTG